MSTENESVFELRSAAKTLSVDGVGNTITHKLAAELLERAANALQCQASTSILVDRAAPLTPAPNWSDAPEGFNYLAIDSDGQWSGFMRPPYAETLSTWVGWDCVEGVRSARGNAFYQAGAGRCRCAQGWLMADDIREELAPIAWVVSMCGLSRANIYRRIREGSFPKPIHVGSRALWPVSRVHAWAREAIKAAEEAAEASRHQVGTGEN